MQSKAWKIDVNVPMVMLFAALTGIALLLTVVAVDAWYKATESEIVNAKWEDTTGSWPKNILKAQQMANLDLNLRINRTHRHVPVSEAMRILIEENGKAAAK